MVHDAVVLLEGGFIFVGVEEGDEEEGEDTGGETGDNFVEAGEAHKVLPKDDDGSAGDHSGEGAVSGCSAEEEGAEDDGAESGTEAGPGIGDEVEDAGGFVSGHEVGDDGDGHNGAAGDPDELGVAGFFTKEDVIEVLGECGSGDEELAIGGRHDGGEDGGEEEACDEWGEEGSGHFHEDAFPVWEAGEEGGADGTDHDGGDEGDTDPEHSDMAGLWDFGGAADGHKADEDMGHTEITEAPTEGREEGDEADIFGAVGEDEEVIHMGLTEEGVLGVQGVDSAEGDDGGDGDDDDGEEHEEALDEVGPADGFETSEEGIAEDDADAEGEGELVGEVEDGIEELGAGDETGGGIDEEEDEDDEGGDDTEEVGVVLEAVIEEIGDCDSVTGDTGIVAEAEGDILPIEVGTDTEAECDPEGIGDTGEVGGAWEAHQEPATHIGGLGGDGGDPFIELAAAEVVILDIFRF